MPILTPQERVGTLVDDKYRLDSILGEGGMGVVYRGEHALTGRAVAVKVLLPGPASRPDLARRFLREARSAARLEHPNVVEVLDTGFDSDGSPYLVLELLRGESLADHMQRHRRVDPARAVAIMLPVLKALIRAHEAGIVHRDFKPDNVFLSHREGEITPKLLDFGIAKVLDDRDGSLATRTGAVMGTPVYMAPEQARGVKDLDAAVDRWAVGVVLFEALSGELPFEAETMTQLIAQILTTDPRRLSEVAPDVPAPIARFVERALSKDPADRFPDTVSMAEALRAAAAEADLDPPPLHATRLTGWSVPPVSGSESVPAEPTIPRQHSAPVSAATSAPTMEAKPQGSVGDVASVDAPEVSVARAPAHDAEVARQRLARPWLPWALGAAAVIGIAGLVITLRPTDAAAPPVQEPPAPVAGAPPETEAEPEEEPGIVARPGAEAEPGAEAGGDEARAMSPYEPEPEPEPESSAEPEPEPEPEPDTRRRSRARRGRRPRAGPPPVDEPEEPPTPEPPPADEDPMELRGW